MGIIETLVREVTRLGTSAGATLSGGGSAHYASAGKDDSSAEQIGKLDKADPSFSAELLGFANSALFGTIRKISGLTQAILLVGVDRVKIMAAVVVINRMVRSSISRPALWKVWIHHLARSPRGGRLSGVVGLGLSG